MLDGPSATRALVVGTLLFQLLVILALQARDTYWGDSWMVSDFVDEALAGGVTSLFRGPYRTLFYDARLYFSCYPFQATFFWLLYGLRLAFGDLAFMAFQVLSALSTSLGVWALMSLVGSLTSSAGARRVAWVLVALCLPMYWLSTFLYGNAMGCGLALAFLAMQARAMGERGRAAAGWWRRLARAACAGAVREGDVRAVCDRGRSRVARRGAVPAGGRGGSWAALPSWRARTRCRACRSRRCGRPRAATSLASRSPRSTTSNSGCAWARRVLRER